MITKVSEDSASCSHTQLQKAITAGAVKQFSRVSCEGPFIFHAHFTHTSSRIPKGFQQTSSRPPADLQQASSNALNFVFPQQRR
jgi:hypothetical protein